VPFALPRNDAQRQVMWDLAETWIGNDYSLVEILVFVTTHDYFVQNVPEDVLETDIPYFLGSVFNAFAPYATDETMRLNSTGDALQRGAARVLVNSVYTSLGWDKLPEFPEPDEPLSTSNFILDYDESAWIQSSVGIQMKLSSSGFRSQDFQTLLVWESWFGTCTDVYGGTHDGDWIDQLLEMAEDDGATVGDVLIALKDRLLTDPAITDEEAALLEAVMGGVSMDDAVTAGVEDDVRLVCGVWLSSPQFQLWGDPGVDRIGTETLVMPGTGYQELCEDVVDAAYGGSGVVCNADSLEVQ